MISKIGQFSDPSTEYVLAARLITLDDEMLLLVETKRILRAIRLSN